MSCHCAKNMLELAKRILLTEPTCVLCFHHFTLRITAVKTRTQIEKGHLMQTRVFTLPPPYRNNCQDPTGSLAGQPNNAPSTHRLREVTTSQKQRHLHRLRKVTDANVRNYAPTTLQKQPSRPTQVVSLANRIMHCHHTGWEWSPLHRNSVTGTSWERSLMQTCVFTLSPPYRNSRKDPHRKSCWPTE